MLRHAARALVSRSGSGDTLLASLSQQLENPWVRQRCQQHLALQRQAAGFHSSSGASHGGHSSDEDGDGPKET